MYRNVHRGVIYYSKTQRKNPKYSTLGDLLNKLWSIRMMEFVQQNKFLEHFQKAIS